MIKFRKKVLRQLGIAPTEVKRFRFSSRNGSGSIALRSGEIKKFYLNPDGDAKEAVAQKKSSGGSIPAYVRRAVAQPCFV